MHGCGDMIGMEVKISAINLAIKPSPWKPVHCNDWKIWTESESCLKRDK
jgi:hypothetical protein